MKDVLVWFAACDGIAQMGPFKSQVDAWKALELQDKLQDAYRRKHAHGAYVWCEKDSKCNAL